MCPLKYIGGFSTKLIIGVCPLFYIGGLSKNKTNIFVLKTFFFPYMAKCMCEGIGEDLRHRAWHVDIRVGMCIILLECVWLSLHKQLGEE